jgi:CHAT domain-containing protein
MRAESVSDYIISSYTPTLKTLLVPPSVRNSFKMMVAIQPETPGYLSLPCTTDELCKIEARVPAEYLLKLGTVAAPASVETVCSHLSSASIAHFACHGEQNINDPLKSALVLADGQLTVSRIMELSMPNASLAFLSACQTAMGDEKLPDEAMHLAATLLFAGFSGAVATMW